jgi:hypothetical protein
MEGMAMESSLIAGKALFQALHWDFNLGKEPKYINW